MYQRCGISPTICRSAVRYQENPRPIGSDSTLTIDLLPRIEHLQALLNGCAHRCVAARFKSRRRPRVGALEIAVHADWSEGDHPDLHALRGLRVGHKFVLER